jgi:hypothetical protein
MKKTGESYTAARATLLEKSSSPKPAPRRAADYAALGGKSDAILEARTGHTWAQWVELLDRAGAATWPHRRIADLVNEGHGVPGWWAQTVAVGYERIKGLREIGQRRDGSYEATKSKTLPVPIAKLYRAFSDTRTRRRWMDRALDVRTATANKSMRIAWDDGTAVQLWFVSMGPAKSQVSIQHAKLPSRAASAEKKKYWEERLAALVEILSSKDRKS